MKDFYLDFSEYSEAVASVLYEAVQKHAFELGSKWQDVHTTVVGYTFCWNIIVFKDNALTMWHSSCIPKPIIDKMSVEEFLKMKKEPKNRVGMPLGQIHGGNVILYLNSDGELPECFTGIALKHDYNEYQYITNGYYDPCCWKPIDPSRIKVTIK